MANQIAGNARNILVGASPLFISNLDVTTAGYVENAEAGTVYPASATGSLVQVPAFKAPTAAVTVPNTTVIAPKALLNAATPPAAR